MYRLSDLTTIRLGGPAPNLVSSTNRKELVEQVQATERADEPLLILGGGSNIVAADAGFTGTVVRILTRGTTYQSMDDYIQVRVQAGEPWDTFARACVDQGLAGVECLVGIPGTVGATPIQNVGAYGQEVADTIYEVVAYDRRARSIQTLSAQDCRFTYRSSAFKRNPGRWIVLEVVFRLRKQRMSSPLKYGELARALDLPSGGRAPLTAVQDEVLKLRAAKGMVLDSFDPDTVSAGSFFLNPVLSVEEMEQLHLKSQERGEAADSLPIFPAAGGCVKTSAARLIERAGFHRGYGSSTGIAISSKHTLALTNRGSGTTDELLALARRIASGVYAAFGVRLIPEPVLVGAQWDVL